MFSRRGSSSDASEGVELTKGARSSGASGPADSRPEGGPGKGRPTPTRKEAEQRRREATKPIKSGGARGTAKEARKQATAERLARVEGLKRGDERYMHARDKGPVRGLVRDYVDSRFCASEFFLPVAVIVLLCSFTGSRQATTVATNIWALMVLVIGADLIILIRRLKKLVRSRYPKESHKGVGTYGMLRALSLRKLRTPAPRVGRGAKV